jgi:cellobiose transport system substrate-binding protein
MPDHSTRMRKSCALFPSARALRVATHAYGRRGYVQWVSAFLLALSLLSMLAACGGASTGGKIQLTLWYWNRSIDDNLLNQVDKVFPNVHLVPEKISDYDNKVRATLAARSDVPDIIGINSNIATYFPDEDQFYDLNTLGANKVESEYLPWKWSQGVTPDGKMIGFPMDTGPTALFYRTDLFAKAGLPTDPQQVGASIKTWNDYLQAAEKMKTATSGKVAMFDSTYMIYTQMLAQSPKQYFNKSTGQYIGDQAYMQNIWNVAAQAAQMQTTARIPIWTDTTEWDQSVNDGGIASFVGAVWMKQILEEAAPDTSGKWRVAPTPGGPGNNGGSFLTVTKYTQHPQLAYDIIQWLQSPQNQLTAYKDIQLYPSATADFSSPILHTPDTFFGGQDTTQVFGPAAKNVPIIYIGPKDGAVNPHFTDQLALVEDSNKNSTQAWNDAQKLAHRELLR